MNYIKWIMVIPAGFAGYLIAMFAGMFTYLSVESLCPQDKWVSEMCTASYMDLVDKIIFIIFPALAAVLVVLLPTLLAPRYKVYVATTAFISGCISAVYMTSSIGIWIPLASCIIAGLLSLVWVYRKYSSA